MRQLPEAMYYGGNAPTTLTLREHEHAVPPSSLADHNYLGVRKSMPRITGLASSHHRDRLALTPHRRHADTHSSAQRLVNTDSIPGYSNPSLTPMPLPTRMYPFNDHSDSDLLPDSLPTRSPNTYLSIPANNAESAASSSSWSTMHHLGVSGHVGARSAPPSLPLPLVHQHQHRYHHHHLPDPLYFPSEHNPNPPCPTAAWSIGRTDSGTDSGTGAGCRSVPFVPSSSSFW